MKGHKHKGKKADKEPKDAHAAEDSGATGAYKADKDGFVEIVFAVDQGKAVARQVKTGIQSDDLIEILEGVKEGEEIVTGSYRAISKDLMNGAVVTINNDVKPEKMEHEGAPKQ